MAPMPGISSEPGALVWKVVRHEQPVLAGVAGEERIRRGRFQDLGKETLRQHGHLVRGVARIPEEAMLLARRFAAPSCAWPALRPSARLQPRMASASWARASVASPTMATSHGKDQLAFLGSTSICRSVCRRRVDELRVLVGGIGGPEPRADREHQISFADDRVGRRLAEVAAHARSPARASRRTCPCRKPWSPLAQRSARPAPAAPHRRRRCARRCRR